MYVVMESARQAVLKKHLPEENDLYVRTLELGQIAFEKIFSEDFSVFLRIQSR